MAEYWLGATAEERLFRLVVGAADIVSGGVKGGPTTPIGDGGNIVPMEEEELSTGATEAVEGHTGRSGTLDEVGVTTLKDRGGDASGAG